MRLIMLCAWKTFGVASQRKQQQDDTTVRVVYTTVSKSDFGGGERVNITVNGWYLTATCLAAGGCEVLGGSFIYIQIQMLDILKI